MENPQQPKGSRDGKAEQSWGQDLRDLLVKTTAGAVFWTILVMVAATGLLRQDTGDVIEPTALWAGIVAGVGTGMWGFLQFDFKRADNGLRADGLPGLLLVGVLLSALIQFAGIMLWPLAIKEPYGSLVTQLHVDPTAALQVGLFVLAVMAWSMTVMFGFASGKVWSGILCAVLFLAVMGLGAWQAIVLFEQPVDPARTPLWVVLAVLGLAVMGTLAFRVRKAAQRDRDEIRRFRGEL